MQSSFEPHNAWIIIGLGLRSAQDVGMHRRRVPLPGQTLSVEDEMKKRSFWCVVSETGRSPMLKLYAGHCCVWIERQGYKWGDLLPFRTSSELPKIRRCRIYSDEIF